MKGNRKAGKRRGVLWIYHQKERKDTHQTKQEVEQPTKSENCFLSVHHKRERLWSAYVSNYPQSWISGIDEKTKDIKEFYQRDEENKMWLLLEQRKEKLRCRNDTSTKPVSKKPINCLWDRVLVLRSSLLCCNQTKW